MRVALFGFEPAIEHSLQSLLSAEPGVEVIRWCPGQQEGGTPDVLVAVPPTVEWVHALHEVLPRTRLLLMVEWNHREQFQNAPVAGLFDRFQGYQGLLDLVLDQQT